MNRTEGPEERIARLSRRLLWIEITSLLITAAIAMSTFHVFMRIFR